MSTFALNLSAKKNGKEKGLDEANMTKSDNFSSGQLVWGFTESFSPVSGRFEIFHYKQFIGNLIPFALRYPRSSSHT